MNNDDALIFLTPAQEDEEGGDRDLDSYSTQKPVVEQLHQQMVESSSAQTLHPSNYCFLFLCRNVTEQSTPAF